MSSNQDNPTQTYQRPRNQRYRGKLSDSLKFNIPDISFGGEQQPIYQPEVTPQGISKRAARILDIANDFIKAAPGLAKIEMEEGKKRAAKGYSEGLLDRDLERARGSVAAAEEDQVVRPDQDQKAVRRPVTDAEGKPITTPDGRPVYSMEEWRQSSKKQWRDLRSTGEVTLHDDPWFQEGYRKGKGELAQAQYRNGLLEWYEREKKNPRLYENPEAFETAIQLRFDHAYNELPDDPLVQESFLKAIVPVQENLKAQYKTDLNDYERNEFLVDVQGRTNAEMVSYRDHLDMVDVMSDEEVQVMASRYDIPAEDLAFYFGVKPGEEIPPDKARDVLKEFAYNDLIDNLNELGDELFHAQGESSHGLGVNPTEARLDYLMKASEDNPILAMRLIRDLKSGTGSLADTSRGKIALGELAQKTKDYARSETNKERQDINRKEADQLEELVKPIEEMESDIASFEDLMREESLTAEQLRTRLMEEIEAIYGDDFPAERAKAEGNVKVAYRRATRPDSSSGPTQTERNRQAIQDRLTLTDVNMGLRPLPSEQIVSVARDERDTIELNRSEYREQYGRYGRMVDEQYSQNPDDERTATKFWNTASLFNELNQQHGLGLRMDTRYSSDIAIGASPALLNTLREADQRGVLGAFIDPSSPTGEAVKQLGTGAGMTPEEYHTAFKEELARSRRVEQEKTAEQRSREDFDATIVDYLASEFKKDNAIDLKQIGQYIPGAADVNLSPEILKVAAQACLDERSSLMRDEGLGSRAASEKATEWLEDNFKMEDMSTDNWFTIDGKQKEVKVLLTPDSDMMNYNLQLADGNEELVHDAVTQVLKDFKLQSESDFREAVNLQLDDFSLQTKNRVLASLTSPDELKGAQETYYDGLEVENLPRQLEVAIDKLIAIDRVSYGDAQSKAAFKEGAMAYIEAAGEGIDFTEDTLLAIIKSGVENSKGRGRPITASTDALKESFFDTAYAPYTNRWKREWREGVRSNVDLQFATPEGARPFLSQYLGEDLVNTYLDVQEMYKMAENFRPSPEFDWDTDKYYFLPVPNSSRFMIQDEDQKTLTTVRGEPLYITKEDVGDRIEGSRRGRITSEMWGLIKDELGSDLTSVDNEELRSVLKDYFSDLPDQLPLRLFRERFGAAGKYVYDIYTGLDR